MINSQGQNVFFSRILTGVLLNEWNHLLHTLSQISFTHSTDRLSWRWESTGTFSVKSLYNLLNFGGIATDTPFLIWSLPIPPKIKIFTWLALKNKILSKHNLSKKGWKGSTSCVFCDKTETINHLFLQCKFAKQIWVWMGKCQYAFLSWKTMKDIQSYAKTLPSIQRTAFLVVFCATCWTIWKHRNEICFQNVTPKPARNLILLTMSLIIYWTGYSKKAQKRKVQEEITQWMPDQETIDVIPLRVWFPDDDVIILPQPEENEADT